MKRILLFIVLIQLYLYIQADQTLEQVWQYQTEDANTYFGTNFTILDFNGDGYDDLIVGDEGYKVIDNDSLIIRGSMFCFEGSESGLSDSYSYYQEFSHEQLLPDSLERHVYNGFIDFEDLGDVNGDGIHDLGYTSCFEIDLVNWVWGHEINIIYGNEEWNFEPDYIYTEYNSINSFKGMGDINGDGIDDMSFYTGYGSEDNPFLFKILTGGNFNIIDFGERVHTTNSNDITGLGDINGDGYNDFAITTHDYTPITDSEGYTRWLFNHEVYFGSNNISTIPQYTFTTLPHSNYALLHSIGDFNGDGYDDFLLSGYEVNPTATSGLRLWLGGINIDFEQYSHIEYYSVLFKYTHSDINHDEKSDLITLTKNYGHGWYKGYLGGINGTIDINEHFDDYFAWEIASGDINNDGYIDILIGSHDPNEYYNNFDKIRMFTSSDNLVEQDPEINTDVASEDVETVNIVFNAFPNPFNPEVTFQVKGLDKNAQIKIYNLRGQEIKTINVDNNITTWRCQNQASAIYIAKLLVHGLVIETRKITLIK